MPGPWWQYWQMDGEQRPKVYCQKKKNPHNLQGGKCLK